MDSTPHSQSSTITSPPKVELDAASREEKRALLVARIEELRARRQAADGAKNRQELMEIRRKKEEAKKERKKRRRLEVKAAEEVKRKEEEAQAIATTLVSGEGGGMPSSQQGQLKKGPANSFSFSTVIFDDGQELDATLTDFKKTRKPKGPSDILGQLKHVETKKARIRTLAPEKQAKIEEQGLWGKALKQAAGEKVRDDEQLLKKSLKRQERAKRRSKREWFDPSSLRSYDYAY